jgi:Protein kinase domain
MLVEPGTRLGPYDIVAPIGSGGMGEVYRARDSRLGRDVAVKVLPPGLLDVPDALVRFEREARAVAALNHPNILALYDVGRDAGRAYAVTELLEGETLRARVDRGPVPARRALELIAQIARGLAAAHDRGIVHRDIKPENLFLTSDGRIKILDFGIAIGGAAFHDGETTGAALTQPGTVIGTPTYMAPEQLTGQRATPQSDLFALGIVAHEILTGAHPFARGTPGETAIAILNDDPASLGRAVRGLPAGAVPLIERCLEKSPAERPGTARDFAFYLEALSTAHDVRSTPSDDTAAGRRTRFLRRRLLVASLGLLLLCVLLIAGYAGLAAERIVAADVAADLSRAARIVRRVQDERLARLSLTAELIASFPELKSLFAETNAATVRDFLVGYQSLHRGTPTLIALLPDGRVLARTDMATASPPAPGDTWIETLITRKGGPAVVALDGRPHHAAAAASAAGGVEFGYVVATTPIGAPFAESLSDATQEEVVLLGSGVLASTLRESQTPWPSLHAWRGAGGRQDRVSTLSIGSERFGAQEVVLSTSPELAAVIAKSQDDATPFRQFQATIVAIGAVCAVLAAAAAFWISRQF